MKNVSICVPTFNGERYLEETLISILNQSYNNFEIVIVDDKSSDATWEIVSRYAKQDTRIKLFRNESNLGLVNNWNKCIELSQGEWIKFVFQDDIIRHDCLELMLKAANIDTPFVFCTRDFLFHNDIDPETKEYLMTIPRFNELFSGSNFISTNQICQAVLNDSRNFFGEPSSTLIHRSIFEHFGPFNAEMVQLCDLEYWIRVGINTGIKYIPDSLAQFRVHPTSTSSKNNASQLYRSNYIDRLILLHEFAYNPNYEPLRRFVKQRKLHLNFKTQLAKRAQFLRNMAYSNSTDLLTKTTLINHWKTAVKAYPKLESSIYLIPYKIESWFRMNLLWRFSKNA
ncbi:hypothetical protein A1359_03345 [Methylomonas lenta]|uniref:Glycosyltransferase 2-like domain-containing protein n=1 Tax=Methylomonas lenta TaxID=980561 RepID=A0A177NR08_9GAMM|nr:glycosyltransferase [Methylomonas lenta]OAI20507.1 hypothetical protein A1359_03345 [Methylomonas lenta]